MRQLLSGLDRNAAIGAMLTLLSLCFGMTYPPQAAAAENVSARVIPDQFLRRWDAVTIFFEQDLGPAGGGAEDHAGRWVQFSPAHPGAYTWLNARTLQFRPAEPWPPLTQFAWRVGERTTTLPTLMEAPGRTVPEEGAEGLDAIERITLVFNSPVEANALQRMVRIGTRILPGVDAAQTRWLDVRDFDIKTIERTRRDDPAQYVLNLHQPIAHGQRVLVRIQLAVDERSSIALKEYSFTTAEPFRVLRFGCGRGTFPVTPDGVSYTRDQAIACNVDERRVSVDFSAIQQDINPVAARNLVRFTPAVADLNFQSGDKQLSITGRFQPETLYRIAIVPLALKDAHGRVLDIKSSSEGYVYFPAKPRYLNWQTSAAIVERFGPQMLPVEGRGFERADVRVHRIDALERSYWPFPNQPVVVDDNARPPMPGEIPAPFTALERMPSTAELVRYIQALGTPQVSTIIDIPLRSDAGAARFGFDLAPLLRKTFGENQPGTYLVGLRRLDAGSERAWLRVQVTDLALTTLDESDAERFAVTSLASGLPVSGAEIHVEGVRHGTKSEWVTLWQGTTDSNGMLRIARPSTSHSNGYVRRIVVRKDQDRLVLDPAHAPDRYADNLWSRSNQTWLQTMQEPHATPVESPRLLCHVFTERPVYRPEEPVYFKGLVRRRSAGKLSLVQGGGTLLVQGPGELQWKFPLTLDEMSGFTHTFSEAELPTGTYQAWWESSKGERCGSMSFSKEAYRVPEFEVQLNAPEQTPLDRAFDVQLAARYYAGGQVAQRPVQWRVTQFPYTWSPPARAGFFFSSDGRFSARERFQATPLLQRAEQTDAQGAARLTLDPGQEPTAQPRAYIIEATVTGADDQTVTSTQRVLALPAVVLGMQVPRYVERAHAIDAQIIAVGAKGELLAGQAITLRVLKREWHSHLQAGDFAQAEPKYVTEVVDNKISEQKLTSIEQVLIHNIALPGAGVYVIEIETHDSLGRAQTVAVDLYAGGDEAMTWSRAPSDIFKVTPDRDHYAPGETAHLILESPFQDAHALAITETPDGNRYQWIAVNKGKAAFDVVIEKNFVPRVPVHFVLMRGRLPGVVPRPGTRIDLGKPATVAATAWLTVDPVEHQLNVALKAPEKALPGATVEMTITLKDRQQRPVAGEVTLWLVDAAVLALGKEQRLDPVPDFITQVVSRVGIFDTRNLSIGELPFFELPGGDSAKLRADMSILDRATLRRDFKSVPYFEPRIKIGAEGSTTVRVKLPDNLTVFKWRAKAVSGADRFGVATAQVQVRLPVIVQPALPRFVRPGDDFTAAAIGRAVEGDASTGQADVRVQGLTLNGSARQAIQLQPNTPARVEYRVQVPMPPINAQGDPQYREVSFAVGVQRTSDAARDAFEIKLPVRPDRAPVTLRQLIDLDAASDVEVAAVNEAVRLGSLHRSILLSDQPALIRMAAGLSFVLEYPLGCTEQQLSRAQAMLAFKSFSARLYGDQSKPLLDRAVANVLTVLPTVIDNDGLIGYWPGATGRVSLTAWAFEFLVDARAAGFNVETKLFERMAHALKQALRSDYRHWITNEAYTERVFALRALAAAGQLDTAYLAELARHADQLNTESAAEIARLLRANGYADSATLRGLEQRLNNDVVWRLVQGKDTYAGLQENFTLRSGLILPSENRTLATLLGALADTNTPRAQLLMDALVTRGTANGWGTTNANAAALRALAARLQTAPRKGSPVQVAVSAGGQSQNYNVGVDQPLVRIDRTDAAAFKLHSAAAKGQVVIARVETRYMPQASGAQASAEAHGFVLAREAQHVSRDAAPVARVKLAEPNQQLTFAIGDVVEEHIELSNPQERNHVAVLVPLAAGLELLNPNLATAPPEAKTSGMITTPPTYVAFLDDQIAFFYDILPKGAHQFFFRTRATVAGTFIQPSARAELMYDDAVYATTPGARVVVK
ncbi:MAG: alpha-2-macroglobulin [Gammaproteobacteria bacterium]|nr:alpha-2-macroglobulin [Gammaproteobacteria bacterium]